MIHITIMHIDNTFYALFSAYIVFISLACIMELRKVHTKKFKTKEENCSIKENERKY